MQLAEALLPERFYAHLVDDTRMYVCFPNCLVLVHRGDDDSVRQAQEIGARFGIPARQMRFARDVRQRPPGRRCCGQRQDGGGMDGVTQPLALVVGGTGAIGTAVVDRLAQARARGGGHLPQPGPAGARRHDDLGAVRR